MTPPLAEPNRQIAEEGSTTAVFLRVENLKNRADFLKASRAPRIATSGFILQARKRLPGEAEGARVGFTCSKKVGNAVARNRAKRRLREVARQLLPHLGNNGYDYVLVGRRNATSTIPFTVLTNDFRRAIRDIHRKTR